MKHFPQYKFEDFYNKRFYKGGVHIYQVHRMFEHAMDESYNEYRFFAALNGVDLDKELKKTKGTSQRQNLDEQESKQNIPVFRDPSEYDNLSQEEREKITKQMMSKHREWVSGSRNPISN